MLLAQAHPRVAAAIIVDTIVFMFASCGRAAGSSVRDGTVAGTSTPIAWSCSKIETQESDPMAYSSVTG